MATCTFCGEPVSVNGGNVFRKVTGWAERRRGGGANAIRSPKVEHDEWAHRRCLDLAKAGHRFGQGKLTV